MPLLCVAHTLVEQMFPFMASSWDQWPWSNWLWKRAKRIIWSTRHSMRTRVLVRHICGHREASPCLGWGRGVEAELRKEMSKGILKCIDPGLAWDWARNSPQMGWHPLPQTRGNHGRLHVLGFCKYIQPPGNTPLPLPVWSDSPKS